MTDAKDRPMITEFGLGAAANRPPVAETVGSIPERAAPKSRVLRNGLSMSPATPAPANAQQTLLMPVGQSNPPTPQRHAQIELIQGSRPDFSCECSDLLRDRLRLTAILLFIAYAAYVIKRIAVPPPTETPLEVMLAWAHVTLTVFVGLLAQRLCTNCRFLLSRLRMTEILLFGFSALFFMINDYVSLLTSAGEGYLLPITLPWTILIFTYALLIPNSWQRATAVIVPMALAPVAVLAIAAYSNPQVAKLLTAGSAFRYAMLESSMAMVIGAIIAIWGVKTIRSLRSEAYEARQLGQYRLKRLLGRGGMGEVYLAEHLMLKRPCAIKLIRPEKAGNPETLARFEREVRAAAGLTHWNSIEIFDYGRTDDGTFYYVMEYLPGMSLDQIVEQHGPLPPARVIYLLRQVCDALREAHRQGLVHRDIKPANIHAAGRGGLWDVAKLLDFGLVGTLNHQLDARLTQDGVLTGSPLYMSPEQATGEPTDARSDIYALGCVAYFLLSGRPPFDETNPMKLIVAHAKQPALRLGTIVPGIPTDLESTVMKCLEKDPQDRFQDVETLRSALDECRDAHGWGAPQATEWWTNYGCPKKRELDERVRQGLAIEEEALECAIGGPATMT